jgi:hypothetical protein
MNKTNENFCENGGSKREQARTRRQKLVAKRSLSRETILPAREACKMDDKAGDRVGG